MRTVPSVSENEIAGSPAWLPLEAAPGNTVRLVHLDEAAYRKESFLDQRLVALGYAQGQCAPTELDAAASRITARSDYIFHTGHVGSTLISRLIGEHAGFFSLREPALLRTLAFQAPCAAGVPGLEAARALLGRTWRPHQRAVVKATSFVSELAESILAATDRPAAIFMYTKPLQYLRGILAGPNSRAESRQLSASRLARLIRRLGAGEWGPAPASEGELIAMSWLCEMCALHQAAVRFELQVLWVDFDDFLGDPCAGLRAIFHRLGTSLAADEIEALVASPLMGQYSKAPEHAYDAELRRRVLRSADDEHAVEIRRGMIWLRAVAARQRLVEAILARAERPGS